MSLMEGEWQDLLEDIADRRCTPFIGEGVCSECLSVGKKLSKKWAEDNKYPLSDSYQISRVAQFLAISKEDPDYPKKILARYLKQIKPPDFSLEENKSSPYVVLADLNLPIYITTNYDLLMEDVLRIKGKEPVSEFCIWSEDMRKWASDAGIISAFDRRFRYKPTSDRPLVYHLHGLHVLPPEYRLHDKNEENTSEEIAAYQSMVLTERDYIDFVTYINKEKEVDLFPPVIRTALSNQPLLFLGYSLDDISFRVIFQGVASSNFKLRREGIAVQIPSNIDSEKNELATAYLKSYTKNMFKLYLYWGEAQDFAKELRQRWDEFKRGLT